MKEAERHEVVLTIRNDAQGVDLHVGPKLGAMARRVLRALSLGEEPRFIAVDTGANGDSAVEFIATEHGPVVTKRTAHGEQDEEALVEEIARAAYEEGIEGKWKNVNKDGRRWRIPEARAVLAHLRAHGRLRTEEDVKLHGLLMVARKEKDDVTQTAEEANKRADEREEARAATEAAYQRELAARQKAQHDLMVVTAERDAEGRKAIAASEREANANAQLSRLRVSYDHHQKELAMANEDREALKKRVQALEASEAHRG